MERYNKYKDSGIEWIGEIPESWESIRLKYIGYLYGGLSGKSSNDFNQDINTNNKPFIPFTNIANNKVIDPNHIQYVVIKEDEKQNKVEKGDLFFMMSSENYDDVGKSTILLNDLGETYLNSFCKGFRFTDDNYYPPFINYLLLSKPYRSLVQIEANGFTRINLKIDKINDVPLKFPSLEVQVTIANYLDRKTAEIDQLITQKESLLELYKEEKTAIINQAVTKGINPDVKFKNSGIDWLGDIPVHWEVKKLKYVANITLGKMLTNTDKGNYHKRKYLRAANIEWLNVNIEDVKEMWFSNDELKKLRLNENDLLVSEGGEVGRTCIWINELEECYIQNSVHKVTLTNSNNPFYFLYQFYIYGHKGAFDAIANKISIAHLTGEKIKDIDFIVPPLSDQTQIVQNIKAETARIIAKAEKTKRLIELLKEYKTALISEVVTGKIKVFDN